MTTRPECIIGAFERQYVYSVAMKYMKDWDAADDVAQDSLLSAYSHLDSFRGESRFTTWLYRIAATTALLHMRKARASGRRVTLRQGNDNEDADIASVACGRSSPEEQVAAREAVAIAADRLAGMGPRYGRVFRMRFAESCSNGETAVALGINTSTVKTRAHRARAAVRTALAST